MNTPRPVEFGVFLPVGRGGWIRSTSAPAVPATYALNRAVALLAESFGFEFLIAMAKSRGLGGVANNWDETLESFTTVAALAEATSRIRLLPTVHTLAFNVAIAAKMLATLDQISNGRAGVNVVSGWYTQELAQMGLWPDEITHDERYDLAREWVHALKRLWSEDSVTFDGKFVHLEDCVSNPKPLQQHPQIVCAGMSDAGLKFTVEDADVAFMIMPEDTGAAARLVNRVRTFAAQAPKNTKAYGLCMVVPADSDAEALQRVALYDSGVDQITKAAGLAETLREIASSPEGGMQESPWTKRRIEQAVLPRSIPFCAFVGSAATIAAQIKAAVAAAGWDGFLLTFPDFIGDLEFFGKRVMPLLAGIRGAGAADLPPEPAAAL